MLWPACCSDLAITASFHAVCGLDEGVWYNFAVWVGGGCGSPTAPVGYLKACSGGLTSLLLVMFTPNMSCTVSFLHFTCRYY